MDKKYIFARTCVYNIRYHFVWCVKCRRKVLDDKISKRLCQLVQEVGKEKGFVVTYCKTEQRDHVHCFVEAPPKISITQLAKYMKGISGNRLLKEYPDLRESLWKGQLWEGSYFVETIGSVDEDVAKKYIEKIKQCV